MLQGALKTLKTEENATHVSHDSCYEEEEMESLYIIQAKYNLSHFEQQRTPRLFFICQNMRLCSRIVGKTLVAGENLCAEIEITSRVHWHYKDPAASREG
jgi:hypothetical protein